MSLACPACGGKILEAGKPCPHCGSHLVLTAVQPNAPAPPRCYACSNPATTRCVKCNRLSCIGHVWNVYTSHVESARYDLHCEDCYNSVRRGRRILYSIIATIVLIPLSIIALFLLLAIWATMS